MPALLACFSWESFCFPKSSDAVLCSPMTAVEDRRGSTRAAGIVGMAILSSRLEQTFS
jgi:hypothetical protein